MFIQVAVYMAAQLPAGVLVDRFGSRVMLLVSGTLLATGQLVFAAATTLPLAVLARVLVGMGDAVVFVAVLALIPRWFAARRVPLFTQVTTILCQTGVILSAVPFAALLHAAGWSIAFLAAAMAARSSPRWRSRSCATRRPELGGGAVIVGARIGTQLRAVWTRPGTKLGFFGHMGTQFSMMVFTLLWGVPYLISAQHLAPSTAGALITLFVVATLCIGPVIGVLTMRHPARRSRMVLAIIAVQATTWTVILALPGPAPLWLLVVLVVVLASGGPGSVIGIDIGRTSNPSPNLGVAQSMVNLGGFLATLLVLATMGALMTASAASRPRRSTSPGSSSTRYGRWP